MHLSPAAAAPPPAPRHPGPLSAPRATPPPPPACPAQKYIGLIRCRKRGHILTMDQPGSRDKRLHGRCYEVLPTWCTSRVMAAHLRDPGEEDGGDGHHVRVVHEAHLRGVRVADHAPRVLQSVAQARVCRNM
eukprot:6043402-Pyramimonas_sp.AAC.1